MKLLKLEMENFGPYVGKQAVDLTVRASAPVILVHGENGRGKSSLFNAIYWCLYQSVTDRRGRPRSTHTLMSYDAKARGDTFMSVTLEFESGDRTYRLERHAEAGAAPRNDAGLSISARLRRNGHFVPAADVTREIANVLHPDIARFFLFDAEMLGQYERLVDDPGRDSDLVRQSIERILGVPALQLTRADLAGLRSGVERQQVAAMKVGKRNQELVAEIQRAEDAMAAIETDVRRLETLLHEAEDAHTAVSEELDQYVDVRADAKQIAQLEGQRDEHSRRAGEALSALRAALAEGWWASVVPSVRERLDRLQDEMSDANEAVRSDVERRHLQHLFHASLESGRCAVCNEPVNSTTRLMLERKLGPDGDGDDNRLDADDRVEDALREQAALRPFDKGEAIDRIQRHERDMRRAILRHRTLGLEIEAVRKRLREHPMGDIGALERRLETANDRVRNLEITLEERRQERERSRSRLQGLQRDIQRLPGANPRISAQYAVYYALEGMFEGALKEFREQVKEKVETVASQIFAALSAEHEYSHLRINEQYGLQIVDKDERVIPEISAGYSQIVALSLVGALNRCATRKGPIVMDSPLARLDSAHRERVLRFVPSMGEQVILLVQSREFDRDRDLPVLADRIGRELTIRRLGPTASEIVNGAHGDDGE